MRFLLGLSIFTMLSACGVSDNSNLSIYNGKIDSTHESVGLLISGEKLWCTATRIGEHTLISAGHCFEKNGANEGFSVRFKDEVADIINVVVHPKYSDWFGRVTNDIAILTMDRSVQAPISAIASQTPAAGDNVTLVGFGYVDATNKESMDGTRRSGQTVIESVSEFKLTFPKPSAEQSQVCRGDSGGPIFSNRNDQLIQVGVVSGSTNGNATKTCLIDAYGARVDTYTQWIIETAGEVISVEYQAE